MSQPFALRTRLSRETAAMVGDKQMVGDGLYLLWRSICDDVHNHIERRQLTCAGSPLFTKNVEHVICLNRSADFIERGQRFQ